MSDTTALAKLLREYYGYEGSPTGAAEWLIARGVRVLPSEPSKGPWTVKVLSDNMGPYWRLDHPERDSLLLELKTEEEVFAVRDALNRVDAAPRPEEP